MNLEKVSFKYNSEEIFKDIRLTINKGDKIALTGENGSGKSTLLKIIAARLQPEEGTLNTNEWDTVSFVEQEPLTGEESEKGIFDFLTEKDVSMAAVQKVAIDLGFTDFEKIVYQNLEIGKLSGGQRKMLALALAISENRDTLVLDEPENHLDIVARRKLAELLNEYKGKLVFVSHDQFMVDAVSSKIAVLEDKGLSLFGGKDFDEVKETKQRGKENALQDWKTEKKDIEALKKALVIMQLKARFNTKGAGVYRSRKRELERRLEELGEKPRVESFQMFFPSGSVERKGKKMIVSVDDLMFKFPETEKYILRKVNLKLVFGERVAIMGRNGSGKTTLLKLITGEISPESGTASLGNDIEVGYFGQIEEDFGKKSALQIFEDSGLNTQRSHAACANLGLSDIERKAPYSKMSGGQKTRLRLALLAIKNPDFIILDEPTNHLDNQSCEFVMEFLSEYKGTLLVVSHDQTFLNSIGLDKFWVVKNAQVTEELGGIEDVIKQLEK
jgi:ATPase subunit of ABC transporter with duplicated ATPase domains